MSGISAREYAALLRLDLVAFIERAFYELNPDKIYSPNLHIEALATALEKCRRGEITRLVVNLPPRSLKSHSITIAFAAYLLGHKPSSEIICISYGLDLAEQLARSGRKLMASKFYQYIFPKTKISPDRQAVNDHWTTANGFRMATSTGGTLTGRGGDFIIIDDPQKPDETKSEQYRNSVNGWFDNTVLSRLNNKKTGCIIIVMQRLHQDDLVGHVLQQGDWHVVSFPAIATEEKTHIIESPLGKSTFHRLPGDVLHPDHEPMEVLDRMRRDIGELEFSAQYQQEPLPAGGSIVKTSWIRNYSLRPVHFDRIVQSWDTANKAAELNDYSVCTSWGVAGTCFYLLDVFRQRLNYPELKSAVVTLAKRHEADTVLIEDKASGTQLIQELQGIIFGVIPYTPDHKMEKEVRLLAQTSLFEGGNVLLPESAPWRETYVTEITCFPSTKYDDQVDSTSQALDYMRTSNRLWIWTKLAE